MSPEIPKGKSTEDLSSLSREELALRATKATNPDEVRKITEAIKNLNKAKGEVAKPDAVLPLSREEIVDQIKRASREGDLNKIKRLNELLTPAAPKGPLLSAQEIQMKKLGIEPQAGTGGEKIDEDLEALREVSSGKTVDGGKPKEEPPRTAEEIPTTPAEIRAAQQEHDRSERKAIETELAKAPPKEKPESAIELSFRAAFAINQKELREIPGYGELTDGQKEMVFENLRQVTLGRIQEEAQKEYRKNTAESKFLGRVWQGISKRYQIAKLERAQSSAFESGGIASHGKYLEKLIAGAREGPEAIRNKDGTLEIKFVSENAYKELVGHDASAAEGEFIDSLNASIANFAKIPDEWALPTATKKEKKEYETAKEEYENARHALIERMNHGRGGQYALEKALNLDEKVAMTQFLSSHPDVEKELQTINSKKLWVRALQNVATERGLYFAFGTASRSIAVGLLGALGAPIAAASMGGFIAHRRAKETVSTEARMSRRGQVKTAEREKSSGERVMRESRDYAKAEVLAQRIDSLIQRIDDGDQKSGIHLKHLDRLVQLTESKLEDGLVNFGKDVQRIENQFTLTKRLGIARAHLFEKKHGRELHERLDTVLTGRKEKVSREQKKYVRSQVIKGALLAGAFAGAGRAAAEYFYAGSGRGSAPPEGAKAWDKTPAGKEYRAMLWGEVGGRIGREPTEEELNAIAKIQKEGRGQSSMAELLSRMRERPEGVSAREIEELYGTKAGIAPPETPIAPPDEEAKIGRAIKEATSEDIRGIAGFTAEQLRESARSGDSVWKITERKLEELYGNKFTGLDEARKTFVIDAIKDEIAKNPEKFGLENIDRIKIGQTIDFSGVLDDKERMGSIFARANDLDDAVRESIVKNNKLLTDWVGEHPREALTSERVEEILRAKPGRPEIPTDYLHDAGPTREESFYNGVRLTEVEAYGSRESAFFAKLAGLSEYEYKTIRTIKIRDILEQIPSEKEARIIWEGQIPGRTINLPHFDQYDKNEFEGHMRLAQILRHYIEGHPHEAILSGMTVDDFFKVAAPEEGPVFRGATPPDFLEPEEFAQNAPQTTAAPIEQTPGKFAQEPYTAEYTPPDQTVGKVLIEGKDIVSYGTAEEAFVAKNQLGMIPREWQDIKSLETRNLLSQTPGGAAKMNPEQLQQWYETQKPKLPGTSFDSFRKQALLADAIRESLKTKSDQEYLKSLPVRELVRNFVLAETGKVGIAEEVAEKAAGFDHSVQAP